jgi:hypothetical protein
MAGDVIIEDEEKELLSFDKGTAGTYAGNGDQNHEDQEIGGEDVTVVMESVEEVSGAVKTSRNIQVSVTHMKDRRVKFVDFAVYCLFRGSSSEISRNHATSGMGNPTALRMEGTLCLQHNSLSVLKIPVSESTSLDSMSTDNTCEDKSLGYFLQFAVVTVSQGKLN